MSNKCTLPAIRFVVAAAMLILVAQSPLCAEPIHPMVLIPAQTFTMGDTVGNGRSDALPAHPVTLSDYYLAPYMVTVQQYCDFLNDSDYDAETDGFLVLAGAKVGAYWSSNVLVNMPHSPVTGEADKYVPKPGTAKQPMYYVTFEGAALYCNWLSEKEGFTPCYDPHNNWACDLTADGYHVPTEAQWECASRAGRPGRLYPWGDDITEKHANYNNNLGRIVDVGSYPPNVYGLYDMAGNVLEWCQDWHRYDGYVGLPSGIQNPAGPMRGDSMRVHVLRGGAYYQPAAFQMCAYRYGAADTKGCFSFNGFRVARQAVPSLDATCETVRTQGRPGEMDRAVAWVAQVFGSPAKPAAAKSLPFSFVLDGKRSSKLLKRWEITSTDNVAQNGKQQRTVVAHDPKSNLEIVCEITTFENFPAVDWLLRITNNGSEDTAILEDLQVLDCEFTRPATERREFILRHSRGSRADVVDFLPTDELLGPDTQRTFAGHGGRPSDYDLPFMNLTWGSGGMMMAVGWSGQWRMNLQRDGDRGLNIQTGMQYLHAKLYPGESIRTPRMLLLFWDGEDMLRGHNLFRQLVLAHYNPRIDGRLLIPPIASSVADLNGYTEENQIAAAAKLGERGIEVQWIDAGWFIGGWPYGAGTWAPRPECFPNGLGPVGDAIHAAGMKFLLWFEIERVSRGSRLEREHPEWVIGPITEYGGLLNWGIPEARRWITDLVSEQITAGHVDIFRMDFNMEPLMYWQRNDPPDRQGITEIRFIESMYQIWDDLRTRHPGLWVDNCASGGRMIDLETTLRSIPLTPSDGPVIRYSNMMPQIQNHGLSLYIPMHSNICFGLEPSYDFRSCMLPGNALATNVITHPVEEVRQTVATYQLIRPYFEGDYYPLFEPIEDETAWFGYQYHLPEQQRGMVVVYRRDKSPDASQVLSLRGIDPAAWYKVTDKDRNETRRVSGARLRFYPISFATAPSSGIFFYEKE